jgi:predicted permease
LKKQITQISPIQTAKVIAVMYFVITIPVFAVMVLISFFGPKGNAGFSLVMLLLPFLYLIMGFIFTAITAAVYNFVAKRIGGIEFTTEETQ